MHPHSVGQGSIELSKVEKAPTSYILNTLLMLLVLACIAGLMVYAIVEM